MTHDLHRLTGAYALHALDDTEARRFERHLDGCTPCTDEVRGFQETAARLALAGARPVPEGLHDRVLSEISRTRQLPPRESTRLPRPRLRGVSWVSAAACLLLAIVLGVTALRAHDRADRAAALNREITSVMTAPDAHAATAHADATGTTTIVASRSLNKIVMTAAQLRAVPATKTYQLWFMTPGSARSAGIMPASPHRPPPPIIAGNLQDAQQIGLTIEPAGGSPHPTSPPLLVIPLT